jgi:hypothetical protein
LAYCYALAAGTYCWEIGDDDIIIDVPWTLLREKLAAGDLDALLLGHDFVDGQGKCHHDPGHEHLLSEQHKYKGDCLDLVCSSPSTFTLISVVILRTSRLKEHLGRSNAGGGYFPLELLMRVAEGGRGEYWPGDRVRGDLDMSWGLMADRFMYHDLPEMLARLARELPSKPVNAAIVAIFRDRYVPWKYLVMHDRHFADWFYRRHGPAIEEGLRLSGGDRAIDELRRHQSLWGQLKSFLALVSFKLRRWTRTHFFSKRFSPESAK